MADDDEPAAKKRRGGEYGRDWICDFEGCTKDFKLVFSTSRLCFSILQSWVEQKKALTTHYNISHLYKRDFMCPHKGCNCQRAIFMVFSNSLFPSFNSPYVQFLALTILRFTKSHDTRTNKTIASITISESGLATATSTRTLPHCTDPQSLLPQEKCL